MFGTMVLDFVVLCANVPDMCFTEFVSLMSVVANVVVGADAALRYQPSYPIDKYIARYVPRLDASRSAMMPVGQALTVKTGNEEHESAYSK